VKLVRGGLACFAGSKRRRATEPPMKAQGAFMSLAPETSANLRFRVSTGKEGGTGRSQFHSFGLRTQG
jgi:hypothetical protein